jgi:LPXTG-motif cell wall-anchored protein
VYKRQPTTTAVPPEPTVTPTPTATVTVTPPGQSYQPKVNPAGIVTQQVRFTVVGTNTVAVFCGSTPSPLTVTVTVVESHAIWADHTTVNAGGKATVSASGYDPGSRVTFTVTSSTHAAAPGTSATADANGVATATLSFATAGTYTVQVLGLTVSGAQLAQTITITVLGAVMPHTGADIVPYSIGGVGLLLVGAGFVLASLRRRTRGAKA